MKKVMIKNIINSLLLVVVLGVSSCNDQLADELFEKRTYLIENGWKDYQLEVDDDNTAILPVYFGINGTSLNDKDITLTLDVDPDTLERYNWEKYKNQKESESPCDDCLSEPVNTNSEKPVYFRSVEK